MAAMHLSFRFVVRSCDSVSTLSVAVQSFGRRDITFLFPPSGNEGYKSNREVPFLSVTFDVVSKYRQ